MYHHRRDGRAKLLTLYYLNALYVSKAYSDFNLLLFTLNYYSSKKKIQIQTYFVSYKFLNYLIFIVNKMKQKFIIQNATV